MDLDSLLEEFKDDHNGMFVRRKVSQSQSVWGHMATPDFKEKRSLQNQIKNQANQQPNLIEQNQKSKKMRLFADFKSPDNSLRDQSNYQFDVSPAIRDINSNKSKLNFASNFSQLQDNINVQSPNIHQYQQLGLKKFSSTNPQSPNLSNINLNLTIQAKSSNEDQKLVQKYVRDKPETKTSPKGLTINNGNRSPQNQSDLSTNIAFPSESNFSSGKPNEMVQNQEKKKSVLFGYQIRMPTSPIMKQQAQDNLNISAIVKQDHKNMKDNVKSMFEMLSEGDEDLEQLIHEISLNHNNININEIRGSNYALGQTTSQTNPQSCDKLKCGRCKEVVKIFVDKQWSETINHLKINLIYKRDDQLQKELSFTEAQLQNWYCSGHQ
eukprot:403374798